MYEELMTNLCFRFLRGGERRLFALLLAITLSVPSFAFAADEASESNAYSAAPARAERLIAKGKVIDPTTGSGDFNIIAVT